MRDLTPLQRTRLWQKENPEKDKANRKRYYEKHKEKLSLKNKDKWVKNKEKYIQRQKVYRENNKDIVSKSRRNWKDRNEDYHSIYSKEWREKYPERNNASSAKRRAAKLKATPRWLTKEHLDMIEDIYLKARELQEQDGIKRHVDHIVPLQGKGVCGLHVPWNLQILTEEQNQKKNNKLEV